MNMRHPKPRAVAALRRCAGFTMIELLVVMAILGILAAAVMPLGEAMLAAQKERELKQALWEIRSAIDEYKRYSSQNRGAVQSDDASGYPPNLLALVKGLPNAQGNSGADTVYFLRRIPRDPMADPALPAEKTWRLRSYASPPDKPAPGADVYDVYSSSDAVGLDGTPYSTW